MSVQQLYEQITELLGKPGSAHIHLLNQLVQILGEKPDIQELVGITSFYDFEQSGFCLYFDIEYDMFVAANLSIRTASVRAGNMKPYAGNLPFEIKFDDSEEEVEKKFPGGTMAVKDYRFDLDLRPLIVIFCFDTGNFQAPGVGRRELSMVSVHYEDALHPLR